MHTRSHVFKAIARTLIAVMYWQPLFSLAAQLRVDATAGAHTQITQTSNGVPMVIIAKPNKKGLSHNKFIDYNVDQQGLILNNSTEKFTQTLLGGTIIGNGYLQGQPAQLILNEVNGGQTSQLKGYTEVAGQQAHVVVANPHGITCDGCGFINTPRVTLTTGKPIVEQGNLLSYNVDGGQIEIAGAGLNATNISQFDLITRSAKINAQLHANQLNIITGRNTVDAQTLAVIAKAERADDKPSLAIDSSALGGMYAGAIRLVGTEAGVGVKLASDMAASAGDIQIDAAGKLTLARVSAKQQIKASAHDIELTQQVYAGDQIKLQAHNLTNKNNLLAANGIDLTVKHMDNQGLIEAGLRADHTLNTTADIRIKSTTLANRGSVVASRNLQVDAQQSVSNKTGQLVADANLTVTTKQLDNQQGLLTAAGKVKVSAEQIDNRHQGEISSQQQLTVRAETLNNSNSGRMISEADLSITAKALDNHQSGIIVADKKLKISSDTIDNSAKGLIKGGQKLAITAVTLNNQDGGRILSHADLQLDTQQLHNTDGFLDTQGVLSITARLIDNMRGQMVGDSGIDISSDALDNRAGGLILSRDTLTATVNKLNNQQGTLVADAGVALNGQTLNNDAGRIISQNNIQLQHSELNNTQGLIAAGKQLTITAQTVENAQGELSAGQKLTLDTQLLQQKEGKILSARNINLSAKTLDNSGKSLISAGTTLTIQTEQLDNQRHGTVISDGALTIQAHQLNNYDKGLLASKGLLQAQIKQLDQHNQGELLSEKAIHLNLSDGDLDNSQGGLIYAPQLQLQKIALINNSQGGEISTPGNLVLQARQLNNAGGLVSSGETLRVQVEGIINNTLEGLLYADQDLLIGARSLDNSQNGALISKGDLSLLLNQQLNNNHNGVILAGGQLQLNSATLKNTQNGLISSQQALGIKNSAVDNSQGGEISSQKSILLSIGELNNQHGQLISEGSLEVTQSGKILDNRAGLIRASDNLMLNSLYVDNSQGGEISSKESVQLKLENLKNTQSGVIVSHQQLKIDAKHIDNQQQGLLSGVTGLHISADSLKNQNFGTLSSSAGELTVQVAGQINNSEQGALVSQQSMHVRTAGLDNQQGIITSQTDIELQVNGDLDNHRGQISGRDVTLSADNLFNTAGQISAEKKLTLTLVKQLLNLQDASLVSGQVLLLTAYTVNNHSSRLASEGLLSVFAQQLRNEQQATIAANQQLQLHVQRIDNQSNIYSLNAGVTVQAQALINNNSLIQARDALSLDIQQQLTNQNGRIISQQGAVSVKAHTVDNIQGVFASLLDRLTLNVRGLFDNQSGTAQGQSLVVQAHEIANQGGHLATTVADLELSASSINNQGGGLYAQQQFVVLGHNLDNSAQGQIAASTIDFSLSGALNNQSGLIEANHLHLLAHSVSNNQGRLRALAYTDDSDIRAIGSFDNRSGDVDIASTNFTLDTPNLLNQSGRIVHAGNGIFDLLSGPARDVGGTVISQGKVSVTSDSWENTTLFQAGSLNFNVGNFKQTASGQLIASRSLTATGHTWINDGLIASDGGLTLSLTGNYSGNGQVISLGDMQLTAQQFALGEQAIVYSQSSAGIGSQILNNQGYISAAERLEIDAKQSLINHGTLGSEQQLNIRAAYLANDNALIFSGAEMLLGVEQFTNHYADVYSLGSIGLAGYSANSSAQRVENISASMEAVGDFSLHSALVENRRDILEVENHGKYYALITELPCAAPYPVGDCKLGKNGKRNSVWQITEREKLEVIKSSAASNLLSGGSFLLSGGELINSSSLISSAADLNLSFNQVNNLGVKPADIEVQSIHIAGRRPKYKYPMRAAYAFNAKHHPVVQASSVEGDISNFIASYSENEYLEGRKYIETPLAGEEYSAIIQAGANLTINAQKNLENSVIRPNYNYVSGGKRVVAHNPSSAYATQVSINSQLLPDLQKKQIDPTVLPGFSLPTGDKGLFRLSGQTAKNMQAQVTQGINLTIGSGFAREEQLVQQGSESPVPGILISSQLAGSDPSQGLYEKSQAQRVLVNLQNLQGQNNGHRYLIETNPALSSTQPFLSSDYLVSRVGFSPEHTQKRLGDGLYEQKLVREAVEERMGQRFIAGLTSDEAVFRYLMDNAISSKDSLNLSVGVSLSTEQVTALTHDIVWMEEREVMGEKVLTPVLYLAQTEGRLASNGALIQGQNSTLVSGFDLSNQGALRASNNLSAYAQNINNSGLIHAGERLSLLAKDSIYNHQGGILAGLDVDLTASTGDILNERTVTRHNSAAGNSRWQSSFADSAARIEATRDLSLTAGRDLHNLGSVLDSRGDLHISAGRDVNLASVEDRHSTSRGSHYLAAQTRQLGSATLAGGNLSIQAGRDLTAVASRVTSGKDMQLVAGSDLTLTSVANESHSYSKSKKATSQRDQVHQVGTQVQSGGQFEAVAGQDLTLVSSAIAANDEAYLVAGGKVQLLAEQDYDYSFSEKKKKGSFGRKSYRMNENSSETAVVSFISAGSDLSIHSGGSLLGEGARLDAAGTLELQAVNDIQLLTAQNSNGQAQAKSKKGLVSSKAKTSEQNQTTAVASMLTGQNIIIRTGRDLLIAGSGARSKADTHLQAGRDIHLTSAEQQSSQSGSKKSSRLGFSNHGLLTQTKKRAEAEQVSTDAVGSYISADNLTVSSGRDSQIQGSVLIAEQNMSISAGRDLSIGSAENSASYASSSSRTQSGDIGKVWQPTVGQVKHKKQIQGHTIQQSGSQLASLAGKINLQAGEHYQQTASQVVAVEGDISIQAQQVSIAAGYDTLNHSEKQSSSRTAIGGAVNIPVVDAALSMKQVWRAATRTDDPRMQALAAATVAMQGKTAYDNAKAIVNGDTTGIKFSVSLGNQKSKSENTQQGHNVVVSSIAAGGDVRIQASGTPNSDVKIIGSIVNAGRDIDLKADRNILLLAAENTAKQNSKNSGSGWSAGIGLGIGGAQNGFSLDLAANQFRGKSDGSDRAWSNTQLKAGRQVNLESGQDTELKGAVVKGEQVTAKVGGDLTIESLQDTSTYTSKSSSPSIGASLCIPPFCAGASTVSGSFNSSKVKGDYASVTEQTGIKTGDGGFQLEVQGHTDLAGAIIASSEKAIEDNLNRLETGTLAARDINNYAKAKAISRGVNISTDMFTQDKYGIAKGVIGNGLNQGSSKDSSTGQTLTAVSAGEIIIRDNSGQLEKTGQTTEQVISELNWDTDNSHTAAEHLDIQALEHQAEAERIIKQAVFAEAVKFSDDAYLTMFIKKHKMYEVILDEDGESVKDADGKPQIRELSFEVKKNLKANGVGKVHVAANGIFNDEYDAAMYAAQNNPETKGGPLYIVSFPKTDSLVAELMVAGYQKNLENNFLGLTNSTEQFKGIMQQHGISGLELDAHSRGAVTVGNAMQSLAAESKKSAGVLGNTSVNFFGAAYSAEKAAGLLYGLSGGKQSTVTLQNHNDDFVGRIIGGNPATYDQRPEDSNKIKEWINIFKDGPTVHSCYGGGKDGCEDAYKLAKTIKVKVNGK